MYVTVAFSVACRLLNAGKIQLTGPGFCQLTKSSMLIQYMLD